MSLQVQFDIEEFDTLKKIRLIDTTGEYSSENTDGYGTPNADYSSVDNIELEFVFPNGESYTIDSSDIGGWTPTASDTDVEIELSTIVGSDLTEFPDKTYTVTYTVYESGNELSSKEDKVFLTGKASICSKNRYTDLCDCKTHYDYMGIVKTDALIRSAIVNFEEDNYDYADDLIEQALKHCENNCINCP